jgi:prepilin-type N-terminal cleavage/methylation domain-containing protein
MSNTNAVEQRKYDRVKFMDKSFRILLSPSLDQSDNDPKGFTLLEILFVMIIMGILTAIALPNFIGQVGKAREAEVKLMMGTIGRAQQAFHYERKQFANSYGALAGGTGNFSSKYVTLDPPAVSGDTVKHKATAINGTQERVRNFAIGVYYSGSGYYNLSLCQSFDTDEDVNVGNSYTDDCENSGIKLY